MKNTQLTVQGKSVTLSPAPVLGDFMVSKFGITIPVRVKGVKGDSVRDLVLAKGFSKEEYKAASKELDAIRSNFYTQSALINGQMAADPTLRKSVRASVNRKGEVIGAVTTYRKEKVASGAAATIAALMAQIELLNAKLALPSA